MSQPSQQTEPEKRKTRFGELPVSSAAKDRRGGTKFFDSAEWVMRGKDVGLVGSGQCPSPSSTVIESQTHEVTTDSPLSRSFE